MVVQWSLIQFQPDLTYIFPEFSCLGVPLMVRFYVSLFDRWDYPDLTEELRSVTVDESVVDWSELIEHSYDHLC